GAQLEIGVIRREALRWQRDCRDDLVRAKICIDVRRVARQPVEICERYGALAARTLRMDPRLKRGERDAHIRGVRRDARGARAKDRVHTIDPIDGGAAASWLALVARRCGVIKIVAARALQEIAAR